LSIELILNYKIPGRHILNSPITIIDKQKADIYCECPNFKEKELVKSDWTYFIKYFPDINIESTDFAARWFLKYQRE